MSEFDQLIETLTNERASSFARRRALETLGALGDERAVPYLVSALKDDDQYTRREAVRALRQVGSSQAVEPLLSVLAEEDDEYVLREAIVALGHIGDGRAVEALTRELDSRRFLNRSAAEEALARIEARQRDAQQEVEQAGSLLNAEEETPKPPQTPVVPEAKPVPDEESPPVFEAPTEILETPAPEQKHSVVGSSDQKGEKRQMTDAEREQLQKAIGDYQREKQEKITRLDETKRGVIPRQPVGTVGSKSNPGPNEREPGKQRGVSVKAIITFVCGMLCLLFRHSLFFMVGIAAVLVGLAERRAIKQQRANQTGNTMVVLGIVCAVIGMFITLISPTCSRRQRTIYRRPRTTSRPPMQRPLTPGRTTVPRHPVPPDAESFGKSTLNPVWNWTDPNSDCSYRLNRPYGTLTITVPRGENELYTGENYDAPRLLRPATGDFAIETAVRVGADDNFEGAGLLVWQEAGTLVRFERSYTAIGLKYRGWRLRFGVEEGGVYRHVASTQFAMSPALLRLKRQGQIITAEYWTGYQWETHAATRIALADTVHVGIHAAKPVEDRTPVHAIFEYFKLTAAKEQETGKAGKPK